MNGEKTLFNKLLLGSFVAHLVLFSILFVLPASPSSDFVPVYMVRIIEAPSQPKVRQLSISTAPISELELDSPTLSLESPPLEALKIPEPTAPETPPEIEPTLAIPSPEAPIAPAPEPPPLDEKTLPALPTLPAPPSLLPAKKESAEKITPQPVIPLPKIITETTGKNKSKDPLEKLREKVQTLHMKFEKTEFERTEFERTEFEKTEAENAETDRAGPGMAPKPLASSFLSLRIYQNRMQEEIKNNYSFPGGFPPGLQVRVRITLSRDGQVKALELLDSSGNEQFDYAAMLTLRRAKFPPIPEGIEGETMTQIILFSP